MPRPQGLVRLRSVLFALCLAVSLSACSAFDKRPEITPEIAAATVQVLLQAADTDDAQLARTVVTDDLSDEDLDLGLAEIRIVIREAGGVDQLTVQGEERMGGDFPVTILGPDSVVHERFSVFEEDGRVLVGIGPERGENIGQTADPGPIPTTD